MRLFSTDMRRRRAVKQCAQRTAHSAVHRRWSRLHDAHTLAHGHMTAECSSNSIFARPLCMHATLKSRREGREEVPDNRRLSLSTALVLSLFCLLSAFSLSAYISIGICVQRQQFFVIEFVYNIYILLQEYPQSLFSPVLHVNSFNVLHERLPRAHFR